MNDPGQNIIAFLFEFGVHPGGPRHGVAVESTSLTAQRCLAGRDCNESGSNEQGHRT